MPLCDLSRETFVQYFGGLYEQSTWVVERAYNTGLTPGHDNPELLARHFRQSIQDASYKEKLALVRSHPDLLGKAFLLGNVSPAASRERVSAGLYHCDPQQIERFNTLNRLYWHRFGFPFVMAVRGCTATSILEEFGKRFHNDRDEEFQQALNQTHRIARQRLEELLDRSHVKQVFDIPLALPVGLIADASGSSGDETFATAATEVSGFSDPADASAENSGESQHYKGKHQSMRNLSQRVRSGLNRLAGIFTSATLIAGMFGFGLCWVLSLL